MSDDSGMQESKVEKAKRNGRYLRGTIREVLASDAPKFEHDDAQLLKFHGVYQQDDRDVRHERRKAGLGEKRMFMVRVAIPGGAMSSDQYLALDALADGFEFRSLRVTTRQAIQFHGVLKGDLKPTIAAINDSLLTTLSACGDVGRNVMTCPAPPVDAEDVRFQELAERIARELRHRTRAYHEIWLDGEKVHTTQDTEPLYTDRYLPRKFKTGICRDRDNCIDVYTQDCGLIAVTADGTFRGFNMVVGGGMGLTHNRPDTFATLAKPLGFIMPEHVVEAVLAVAGVLRDFGNRVDRRHARLKYLIDECGMDWFRRVYRDHISFDLHAPLHLALPGFEDHLGWHPQHDGRWHYGLHIDSGRIIDREDVRVRSALRAIMHVHHPGVRLTAHQNMLLTDLNAQDIPGVESILEDHGVRLAEDLSAVRRFSMACPAFPTCGLALAESERFMPVVMERFEDALCRLGVGDVPLTLRMTGCPNGCARPYTADIAFVGRRPDVYHVYVGGSLSGARVADLFAEDVPADDLVEVLHPLLSRWARERSSGEGLGDFYQRLIARDAPRQRITGRESPTRNLIQLEIAR